MDFLAQNWFYILVLVLFVGMHLAGFGCGHHRRPRHKTVSTDGTGIDAGRHGTGLCAGNSPPEAARDRKSV